MAAQKTNAVRLLERLGVPFELREYEVDPDDLAAVPVALKVGLPPEQVFKTLVARGDKHGVCLDETAHLFDVISISAGMRGLQVFLAPDDYIRVVDATVVPIARDKS